VTVRHFGEHHDEIIDTFLTLKAAWEKAEPKSNIALYFASYHESFLDMARAVVAARYAGVRETTDPAAIAAAEAIGDVIFDALGVAGWDVSTAQHGDQLDFRIDHSHLADNDGTRLAFAVTPAGSVRHALLEAADAGQTPDSTSTPNELEAAIRAHETVMAVEFRRMELVFEYVQLKKPVRFKRGERRTLELAAALFPFLDHVDAPSLRGKPYRDIVSTFALLHYSQEFLTAYERELLYWAEAVFKFLRPEDYEARHRP
jgi:hypothetical protein